MKAILSRSADRDTTHILRESLRLFGPRQMQAYAALIDAAIALVADDPDRPAALRRPELGRGIRSFHLELAAGRRGAAAHSLYFTVVETDDDRHVLVVRIHHDRMEPRWRLARALRPAATDK